MIESCNNKSAKNALPSRKLLVRKKKRHARRLKRSKRRQRSSPRKKQRPKQRRTRRRKRKRRDQSEDDPRNADLPPILHHLTLRLLVRVHKEERRPARDDLRDLDPSLLRVEAATAAILRAAARILRIPTLQGRRTALGRIAVILLPGAAVDHARTAVTERDH